MSDTTFVAAGDDHINAKKGMIQRLAEATPVGAVADLLSNIATTLSVQIIDPFLDRIERTLEDVRDALRIALLPPEAYLFTESGESFSDADAKDQADHVRNLIAAHRAAGSTIDQRAPSWLVIAGKIAPWAEVLGIAVFVTALWNVHWLAPWNDWLTFFTALVLVVGMPIMQKYFAEHGGKAHNDYRLAKYEGLDIPAREQLIKRNWYLTGAFVVATAGMVILAVRGIIALDAPTLWETLIIGSMAAIVGYGTVILAYSATATDGTRYQREADELTAQGEAYASEWKAATDSAKRGLNEAQNDEHAVIEGKFPKVLEIVRLQPGGARDEEVVNLLPLAERARRLRTLQERRLALADELNAVKTDHRPAFLLNA